MTDHLKTLRELVAAGEKLRAGYKAHCETTRPGTPLPLPLQTAQMEIIRLGSSPALAALLRVVEAAKVYRAANEASETEWDIPPSETNAHTRLYIAEHQLDSALAALEAK